MKAMKVAVLFSGGKDSSICISLALDKGWKIEALIAVKPRSNEAYLWHYPTVEWTILSSEALGIPLIMLKTDKIGPEQEAKELEKAFKRINIDALLMGGVGLQKTQIREVKKVADRFGIKVIIPYENLTSEELLKKEIESGLDFVITNVATDGLGPDWLGRKIDLKAFEELKALSKKYGFDILGEGGHYDSLVLDAPFFKKKIEFLQTEKIWDNKTSSGYLEVKNASLIAK